MLVHKRSPRSFTIESFFLALSLHVAILFSGLSSHNISAIRKTNFSANSSDEVKFKMRLSQKAQKLKQKETTPNASLVKKKSKPVSKAAKSAASNRDNLSRRNQSSGQKTLIAKYLQHIQKILNENKFYPLIAKRLGREGVSIVGFVLGQNGGVVEISSIEGADPILNKAARELVEKRAHFPSFPKSLKKDRISVVIPIVYEL